MVSATKKPLAASITFLAVFSIIVIAAGAYLVIENLRNTSNIGTTAQSSSVEEEPHKYTASSNYNHLVDVDDNKPKTSMNGLKRLQLAVKKVIDSQRISKETKTYCELLEKCSKGTLRPETRAFLDEFEADEFERSSETEEDLQPEAQVKIGMDQIEKDSDPENQAICTIKRLANTFGVLGSDGKVVNYSRGLQSNEPDPLQMYEIIRTTNGTAWTIHKDNKFECADKNFRVQVFTLGQYDGQAFSDDNLKAFAESLFAEETSFINGLKQLDVPVDFFFIVGLHPEQSENLPIISGMEYINGKEQGLTVAKVSNLFKNPQLDGNLIWIPGKRSLTADLREELGKNFHLFNSVLDFKKYFQSKGFIHFNSQRFSSSKSDYTIYYGAIADDDFDELNSNISLISDSIISNNFNCKYLSQKPYRGGVIFLVATNGSINDLPETDSEIDAEIEVVMDSDSEAKLIKAEKFVATLELENPWMPSRYGNSNSQIFRVSKTKYHAIFQVSDGVYYFILKTISPTQSSSNNTWKKEAVDFENESGTGDLSHIKPSKNLLQYFRDENYKNVSLLKSGGKSYQVQFIVPDRNVFKGIFGINFQSIADELIQIIQNSENDSDIYPNFEKFCDKNLYLNNPNLEILVIRNP